MGIGPIAVALYRELFDRGVFQPGQTMIELGSQDVTLTNTERVRALLAANGKDVDTSSSRALMLSMGFAEYDCIDMDGRHGAMALDLNEPIYIDKQYDIVTNHGTTEHVFDQAACFRLMHDLTRVGGVMIHCIPMQGYLAHGMYCYTPELFHAIAYTNRYERLGEWTALDNMNPNPKLVQYPSTLPNGNILLCVVLRRKWAEPFKVPMQQRYGPTSPSGNIRITIPSR